MKDYKTDIQRPERSTVTDVLAYFGKDVRISRSGFMKSPFRDESTPSFHVTPNGRGWKDFGDGSGGGVIDLVMRLSGKDRSGALHLLGEMEGSGLRYTGPIQKSASNISRKKQSFRIYSIGPVTSLSLLEYSRSRCISDKVLMKYCREVTVKLPGSQQKFINYIGFPNIAGGYILRNGQPAGNGKRCTSSAPSFIDHTGEFTDGPSCDSAVIFEGFFDFLSYIQLYHPDTLAPECDVCVLNSITNREKASHFLLSHNQVFLYLDNDPAGRKTSDAILSESVSGVNNCRVIDKSGSYNGFKDFNEFLFGQGLHRQESDNTNKLNTNHYGDTGNKCGEEGDYLP